MEASLLLAGQDVPDDDGLRVLLGVHQRAEGHHVPGGIRSTHGGSKQTAAWSYKRCVSSPKATSSGGYLSHGEKSMRDTP